MENIDLGSLVLVGVGVSILVQLIKKYIGTSGVWTMVAVLAVSIVGSIIYVMLKDTAFFTTFVQVLITAGGVYSLIIRQFEKTA